MGDEGGQARCERCGGEATVREYSRPDAGGEMRVSGYCERCAAELGGARRSVARVSRARVERLAEYARTSASDGFGMWQRSPKPAWTPMVEHLRSIAAGIASWSDERAGTRHLLAAVRMVGKGVGAELLRALDARGTVEAAPVATGEEFEQRVQWIVVRCGAPEIGSEHLVMACVWPREDGEAGPRLLGMSLGDFVRLGVELRGQYWDRFGG